MGGYKAKINKYKDYVLEHSGAHKGIRALLN